MNARVRKTLSLIKLKLDRRFLKKNNCLTWKEYYYKNDPRIYLYADHVTHFYKGYKHISVFESSKNLADQYGDWLQGLTAIKEWCDKNCIGNWRQDIHRVYKQTGIGLNGSCKDEWFLSDIGGFDILFFAFNNERDYILFNLRWQ